MRNWLRRLSWSVASQPSAVASVGRPVAEPPAAAAGDVENGVDPTEPLGGVRDCLVRGTILGQVGGQVIGLAALAADALDQVATVALRSATR